MIYPESIKATHQRYMNAISSILSQIQENQVVVHVSHGNSQMALAEYWKNTLLGGKKKYCLYGVPYACITILGRKDGKWELIDKFAEGSFNGFEECEIESEVEDD